MSTVSVGAVTVSGQRNSMVTAIASGILAHEW
jgi:hypothetical protein